MLNHSDDFLPFTSHKDTGDALTSEQFALYCADVRDTHAWGGQMELRALSRVLQRSIEVYQAQTQALVIGEEYQGADVVRVSYHRYQYGLGEHYNAVVEDS